MKLNWGTGIIIFLVLFFIAIFWFVWFSFNTQQDLVVEDYYPQDIKYEERIQKIKNTYNLKEQITLNKKEDHILLTFPKEQEYNKVEGTIEVYRPSDSKLDLSYDIKLDSLHQQKLETSKFLNGKYIVKVEWAYGNLEYYQEISFIY